jgi:hypothetical protein
VQTSATRRFGSRFGLFCAGSAIALFGCDWDWTVRSTPQVDASTVSDAGTDAQTADADVPDVVIPVEASDDCTTLLADVASTEAQAITCTLGDLSDCVTLVDDECGCGVFVGQTGSTASQNFANAVASAKAASCTSQCAGCTTLPTRGTCIETGSSFTCSPP